MIPPTIKIACVTTNVRKIGTRKSAEAPLRAVRYEPEGIRGSCPAIRQANYGPPNWKEFQDEANR